MAVIKVSTFGGEMPSISPRALPDSAAQENRNLFTSINEFRPIKTDLTVAACSASTKTLHRFARKSDGTFNSDVTTGWISSTVERSYVKGQIDDERSERTYFTIDDGSARPRLVDVNGSDRVLGVPRPVQPTVTKNTTEEFTSEEANTFLYGPAAEAIRLAIISSTLDPVANEPSSRFSGSTIYGGPYTANSLSFPTGIPSSSHWNLYAAVGGSSTIGLALDIERLGAYQASAGATIYVPLTALPFTFRLTQGTLTTAIQAIQFGAEAGPAKVGTQVFGNAVIALIVADIAADLDPDKVAKSQRDILDATSKEFYSILTAATFGAVSARPTAPVKPTVADEINVSTGQRTAAWVTYDAAVTTYNVNLAAYNAALLTNSDEKNTLNTRIQELQARARVATQTMEAALQARWKMLTDDVSAISAYIVNQGGVGKFVGDTTVRKVESRFYIVTFVTDFGEESEPSPVSALIELDQNDSVTVGRPTSSSAEAYTTRSIQKWRIYRSNTGSAATGFQFVDELLVTSATYTDTKTGSQLGENCPSITWAEPPYRMDGQSDSYPKPVVGTNPYIRGFVGLPNGVMAGFFDNTVAFCEPYVPYAWPVEYQISTEHPIVGLGVFGQTVFVGTLGNPYFISGASSGSMSSQKLDSVQACVAKRSIVAMQGGVFFASPDGLCLADPNGIRVLTKGMYTREDWQALSPSTMFAESHEDVYYLFFNNGTAGCLTFDFAASKLARVDLSATAVYANKVDDLLYIANGTNIQKVYGGSTYRTGKWKSARAPFPMQATLAWVQIFGDQTSENPVTFKLYGDGALVHTVSVTSISPLRLPAGRWLEFEIQIESAARVTKVTLAGSTVELQNL
jgi:hypothetical protein